jgi:signal transduction histidine kinase
MDRLKMLIKYFPNFVFIFNDLNEVELSNHSKKVIDKVKFNNALDYIKISGTAYEYETTNKGSCYLNRLIPTGNKYILVMTDITEQRRLEKRILKNEIYYKDIFDVIGIGVWELNLETKRYKLNSTLQNMLNFDSDTFSYRKWIKHIGEDFLDEISENFSSYIKGTKEKFKAEYRLNRKEIIWVQIEATAKTYYLNKVFKIIGTFKYITKEKEMEKALIDYNKKLEEEVKKRTKEINIAKEMAEQKERTKSQFIANLSHEFNTPLNLIFNYAKIGLKKNELSSLHGYLKKIEVNTEKLIRLMDDILTLVKIDSNLINFNFRITDIENLLNSSLNSLKARVKQSNINIKTIINTPKMELYCDSIKISHVIRLIINNSLDYSETNSTIVLSVSNTEKDFLFSIKDDGVGIDTKEHKKVFERFTVGSNTYKERRGLGLSIAKEIILKHNGKIWIENNIPKGVIVYFTIPFKVIDSK